MNLRNAWLNQLHHSHANLLAKLGINNSTRAKMRVHIYFFRGQSHWGYWSERDQAIGLNLKMIETCPWSTVLGILAHETAHQAVDYLSPSVKEKEGPHGPTFQAYCQIIGVDPVFRGSQADEITARLAPNPFGPQKEREPNPILLKVQKLLALSTSPEPAEAEAALTAAGRLMAKHNLELAQEEKTLAAKGFERWILPIPSSRFSMKYSLIATILRDHFFVEVIIIDYYDHLKNNVVKALEILGRPINLVMAEHVFHFLAERTDTLWSHHKPLAREKGETGLGAKNAFIESLLRSFLKKLKMAESQAIKDEGALSSAVILRNDVDLSKFVRLCHPNLRTTTSRASSQAAPFSRQAGAKAGQELTINPPLGQADGQPGGTVGFLENRA
jgi:hypothetical protein